MEAVPSKLWVAGIQPGAPKDQPKKLAACATMPRKSVRHHLAINAMKKLETG
jgi:hypothetical protein